MSVISEAEPYWPLDVPEPRNFLEEAHRIARGESMLRPEPEHLRALIDSRDFWRDAALQHHPELSRRAS